MTSQHIFLQICTDTTSFHVNSDIGVIPTACTHVCIVWQMEGMDFQIDTKIGSYLAQLVNTLTLITGEEGSISRESSSAFER